jgi:hypothetical protein
MASCLRCCHMDFALAGAKRHAAADGPAPGFRGSLVRLFRGGQSPQDRLGAKRSPAMLLCASPCTLARIGVVAVSENLG